MDWIKEILNKPALIGVIANANEGKSNLLYNIIETAKGKTSIKTFGLKCDLEGTSSFNSIEELEIFTNSLIIIDEFISLFDVDNRHNREQIETILRLIFHNNNILVLSGLPENFKKFISAKLGCIIYKRCFFGDFIRGSNAKKIIDNFKDVTNIKGTTQLNLNKSQVLVFNNNSYLLKEVNYLKDYDTKKNNQEVIKW